MRLEAVGIKRFRSIEDHAISKCGDFNVLIGKNNAGKSNILAAINAFFKCIDEANIFTTEPPIGKPIDFFNNSTKNPIEITLKFSLTASEKHILVEDIVTEMPQMKNSIEEMDTPIYLSVTVKFTHVNVPRAYVSKITMSDSTKSGEFSERIILGISQEAAFESFENYFTKKQLINNKQTLKKIVRLIDVEVWDKLISRETKSHTSVSSMILRFLETSSLPRDTDDVLINEMLQRIDSLMEVRSYAEFTRVVEILRGELLAVINNAQDSLKKNAIITFAGEGSSIPKYAINILRKISDIKLLYLTEQRKQIDKEEAERLLSLKVQRGGSRVLQNIQEVVASLLGVRVDAFQGATPSKPLRRSSSFYRNELNAELDVDNFSVEVNGSGIREALRLVLDYEFKQPDVLLIEEPEVHLHPALETSMMRYLKQISTRCQVFITTHSTNFLDTAEMKNVYLISKPASSTKIQLLDLEEAETQIPRELGIRLSSLFMFDRLVFVEGISDASIIREWSSTLKINLSKPNVGFIVMGGARNFTHYAAESILTFLTKRQVKIWFLLDKDERGSLDVQRLERLLSGRATLKVLNKREIENYLLCPRALKEFITLKKGLNADNCNDDLIEEDIKLMFRLRRT